MDRPMENWMALCVLAYEEKDLAKLVMRTGEILRLLYEKDKQFNKPGSAWPDSEIAPAIRTASLEEQPLLSSQPSL